MVADTAQWMMEVAGLCASAQVVAGALRNTTWPGVISSICTRPAAAMATCARRPH